MIQRSLQNPLATLILEGRIKEGETVKVTVEKGELVVGGQRVLSEAASSTDTERAARIGQLLSPPGDQPLSLPRPDLDATAPSDRQ